MNGPAVDVAVGKDVEKGGSEDPKGPRRWWKSTCAVLAMQSWSDFLFAVCFAVGLILLMELTTPTTRTIQVYDATLRYVHNAGTSIHTQIPNGHHPPTVIKKTKLQMCPLWWSSSCRTSFCLVVWVSLNSVSHGAPRCHGPCALGVTSTLYSMASTAKYSRFLWWRYECRTCTPLCCIHTYQPTHTTQLTKPLVGYPRPTFLSTCQPLNTNNVTYSAAGVVCSNTDQGSLNDAREAFPSGHAATATAVMIYIIVHMLYGLYAQPRARVFRFHNRFEYFLWDLLHTISLVYLVAVFCYAWFMGCSRVMSNYHSPADVTAGWVLGISLGLLFGARAIGRAKYLTSDLTTLYYA